MASLPESVKERLQEDPEHLRQSVAKEKNLRPSWDVAVDLVLTLVLVMVRVVSLEAPVGKSHQIQKFCRWLARVHEIDAALPSESRWGYGHNYGDAEARIITSVCWQNSREGGEPEGATCENAEQLVGQKVLEREAMGHLVHGQREAVIDNASDRPGHQEENRPRGTPHLVSQEYLRSDQSGESS